jgi:choline dehydrogenase-like flavoprotein
LGEYAASIMPTVTRGNTNIPTLMVAEKISDEMLSAGIGR